MTANSPIPPPPSPQPPGSTSSQPFPKAVVVSTSVPRVVSRLWWLTGLSLVIAIVLIIGSQRRNGPRITIHFADGHGLKAGDTLRYRGITVGEVTDVALRPGLSGVDVAAVLEIQASPLARKGSEFWIERPRVSLSRVSGLETVVGAKFIGVRPGAAEAAPTYEFEGIESPPVLTESEFSEITIRFSEGYGLQAGDPVRYRGIMIGEVTSVDLEKDLSSVAVRVRLTGMGSRVAREGSQFWVERPRVSVAEVRGLDTLVGGRYIAVSPGADEATASDSFIGLETAPVSEIPTGGLEILLHAPQRWGVDRGVPVAYRGLRIGQVTSVGLSSDGTRIEARAVIDGPYRMLVRRNSVFWSTSGIDVNVGLTGLQLTADTLSTIALGGIAFATPEAPGEPVGSGHRFAYERAAQDEWTQWRPHINLNRPGESTSPEPLRAVVRWTEKSFGFSRKFERSGWVNVIEKQVLGPAELLLPTEHPIGEVALELAGTRQILDPKQVTRSGLIARVLLTVPLPDGVLAWPTDRTRRPADPEDILIISEPQATPHPLAASSMKRIEGGWEPEANSGLHPTWHGAPVMSARDGKLIGVIIFQKGKPLIVPIESQ